MMVGSKGVIQQQTPPSFQSQKSIRSPAPDFFALQDESAQFTLW